jgi:hypothetical protein
LKKSLSFAKRKNLKKKIAQKFLLTAFNLKRWALGGQLLEIFEESLT